jgi:hypothetical protein
MSNMASSGLGSSQVFAKIHLTAPLAGLVRGAAHPNPFQASDERRHSKRRANTPALPLQKIFKHQMDRDLAARNISPLGRFPQIVTKLLAEFG